MRLDCCVSLSSAVHTVQPCVLRGHRLDPQNYGRQHACKSLFHRNFRCHLLTWKSPLHFCHDVDLTKRATPKLRMHLRPSPFHGYSVNDRCMTNHSSQRDKDQFGSSDVGKQVSSTPESDQEERDILEDASSSTTSEQPPVPSIDLQLPRRRMLVTFTCNVCGERTERLVNPLAWEKGLVIVQCGHCSAWHKLADNARLIDEIRFDANDDEEQV